MMNPAFREVVSNLVGPLVVALEQGPHLLWTAVKLFPPLQYYSNSSLHQKKMSLQSIRSLH